MFRVMPALEAYAVANVATQNLMGGNPIQVILGDLNTTAGTGMYGGLMGPQPGVITIKEMLTGTMNTVGQISSGGLRPTYTTGITTSATSPLEAVSANFQANLGNIVVGTALTTAGFRIANKVLRKPKTKMNKLLRDVGLGSTVQL
tara:strand:+ start:347 stop:784 length:438 start_codon:yes stop_codon:yes gene_type:complete